MKQISKRGPKNSDSKVGDFPKPVGSAEELKAALEFLEKDGAVLQEARITVDQAVNYLLGRRREKPRPRLSEDLAQLDRLARHGRSVSAEIERLSPVTEAIIGTRMPWRALKQGKRLGSSSTFRVFFRDFEAAVEGATEQIHANYGDDRGGRGLTMSRLAYGDPYEYFFTRLIDLYGRVHGEAKVTGTIGDKNCYGFVDAVHDYALGVPIGREKLFKQIVKRHKRPTRRRYSWIG